MFSPNEAGFAQLDRAVSEFERDLAEHIADAARSTVAVKTGATRDSIQVVEVDGHHEVTVGGAGVYLELGTATMSPEPFLQPAVDRVAREVPAIAHADLGAVS